MIATDGVERGSASMSVLVRTTIEAFSFGR